MSTIFIIVVEVVFWVTSTGDRNYGTNRYFASGSALGDVEHRNSHVSTVRCDII